MTVIINQETIKEHIIHRYENLLLDDVSIDTDSDNIKGSFSLKIEKDDPLGRQIFSKNINPDTKILTPQLCMESLALASIVCSGKLKEGQMAIFAGISNFKKLKHLPFSENIIGEVEKQGSKGAFLKYRGTLKDNSGNILAFGDMMAYFTSTSMSNDNEEPKKIEAFPIPTEKTPINKTDYPKPSQMVVLDHVLNCEETQILGDYTYPTTHPFTKGHFPENPIMMGIMQWISVEDLALQYAKTNKITGEKTLKGNAVLFKHNYTLVAEVKQFECSISIGVDSILDQCDVIQTRKIVFRNMVRPGETILILLKDITIT
ncbi:hypothetical protein DID80_02310 [Candidatus Marinamargulisbacteria bacterium SCGC AAA071-K20]|nr:hypothetical protein DID80_02310 [Candidatus Marinamargulisbacteria bacterium SCGC AAA071-K20]